MRAENARGFSPQTARISMNFCRVLERNAHAWLAEAAQRHLHCSARHRAHQDIIFVLVLRVWRSFRADSRGNFLSFSARTSDAKSHRLSCKIDATRPRDDCKTCAGSTDGPGRLHAASMTIFVIVRCVARRKCARFFAAHRADFDEFLPIF